MKAVEGRAEIEDIDRFLASIGGLEAEYDCAIQAFDADYVLGRDHLRAAVEHADRAFDRGENVARERAVEILLYAAGRRQINRALQMGVGEGESDVVVVVHDPHSAPESEAAIADPDSESDGSAEENAAKAVRDLFVPASANALAADCIDREAVRDFFDVSEHELAASDADLVDLVCERVALLDVKK
jgi:KEOPS complex subunit Cgi121